MERFLDSPLLRTRDGALFLSSQSLDSLAAGVAGVALPWLVLDATGSAAAAGLVFALEVVPYVVFGLFAGLAGDRLAARRLIIVSHLIEGVFALAIPLWAIVSGTPPLWLVATSAFMIGSARVFVDAGAFGAIASVVGPERFTSGQSLLSSAWAAGTLIGPALGGILVASIGPARTLFVEAVAFVVAAALIALVRTPLGSPNPSNGRLLDGVAEGLRFIATDRVLRPLTAVGWVWNIASAGSFALLVPLLRTSAGLSAHETGVVLACGAGAGLTAAPILHVLQRRYNGQDLYLAMLFASTVPTAAIGYARGLIACIAAIIVLNLVLYIEMSTFIGARQTRAPAELQARVGISGRMVMTSSLALGSLLASALTRVMSLPTLFAAMAGATVLVGLVAVRTVPRDG